MKFIRMNGSPYRSKIVELYDEGFGIGRDEIFVNLLNFISESDAKEFWEQYCDEDEIEEEDEIWATKIVPGVARF